MINLNPETLVSAIICINFLSVAIYAFLIRQNRSKASTLFLVAFCFFLSLNQLYDLLTFNKIYGAYLRFLDEFSLLLAFPSLYFYILSLTQNNFRFHKKHLLHLLPLVLFLVIWVFPLPFAQQLNATPFIKFLYQYYNKFQAILYIILINNRLNKHQKISKDLSSTAKENDLNWVRVMLIMLILISFFWLLSGFGNDHLNLTGYALVIFSYWIGYHMIAQKSIYIAIAADFEIDELKQSKNQYKNSNLSTEEKSKMADHIRLFMTTEKPYHNNELTLTSLADRLKMKPVHLSQILNEEFKENFYKFINRHRVDESKKLLLDPRYSNYNILGIALEAGFNSKSTFNKAFKEITGISPSEFQRNSTRPS